MKFVLLIILNVPISIEELLISFFLNSLLTANGKKSYFLPRLIFNDRNYFGEKFTFQSPSSFTNKTNTRNYSYTNTRYNFGGRNVANSPEVGLVEEHVRMGRQAACTCLSLHRSDQPPHLAIQN